MDLLDDRPGTQTIEQGESLVAGRLIAFAEGERLFVGRVNLGPAARRGPPVPGQLGPERGRQSLDPVEFPLRPQPAQPEEDIGNHADIGHPLHAFLQ